MNRITRALLLTIALAASGEGSAQAREERRVEGRVLETKLQICQLKPRGCAGTMILETERAGTRERLSVRVQLGVPIRRGEDYVSLGVLGGSRVKVVYITEKGSIVAQWIEVLEGKALP
jgi:hypothetical protein